MPPKPATKAGAKTGASKTTPAKPGAAKAGPGASKTPSKPAAGSKAGAAPGKTEEEKKVEDKMAKMAIKKVLVPEEIELKQVGALIAMGGEVAAKLKDSGRWLFMIDRNGNVHTFLKYRDVNMISATSQHEFQAEPLRKALIGALRFGKPHIVDISDTEQSKAIELMKERYNEIYQGCWDDLMDHSIMEEDKRIKLYRPNDDDEYKNTYDYRVSDFQFMVYTNTDPPSTANEDFFPVIIN